MRGRLQVGLAHIVAVSATMSLNQRKFLSIFFRVALGLKKTVVVAVRKMEAGISLRGIRVLIIFDYFCLFLFIFVYFCLFLFIFVFRVWLFLIIFVYFCLFLFIFVYFCLFLFLNVFKRFLTFLNVFQVRFFLFFAFARFLSFVCDSCFRIYNLESRGNGWRPYLKMRLLKVDRQMYAPRVWVAGSYTGG